MSQVRNGHSKLSLKTLAMDLQTKFEECEQQLAVKNGRKEIFFTTQL
jgi:hypothetical protein